MRDFDKMHGMENPLLKRQNQRRTTNPEIFSSIRQIFSKYRLFNSGLQASRNHITYQSVLPALPKTSTASESSRNFTGLKVEKSYSISSRTPSPILNQQ